MMDQERLDKAAEAISGLVVIEQVMMLSFLLNKVLEPLPKEIRSEVAEMCITYALEYAKKEQADEGKA